MADLGLKLRGDYLPDDDLGYYSPSEGLIYFDLRLTPDERRCVIAHECGHAYYGHGCDSDRHERQANTYAAQLLIDPVEYARLERLGSDSHHIADEIGVTVELLEHYQQFCLQRLGHRTYSTGHNSPFTSKLARALTP
ncbi:ImmA/IrrE family metallo-endopeptidase [Plantibacter sp. YIM 135249]|uniref:ImmA/IrrE family metallo-endopeptidase n=1 Tax=Plantibacter sp. YIM 135249 TaxID=3423918 RepID=UPI003D32B506